jgi:hypothetical protein
MTTPKQTVCEVCHERLATHFVCNANTGKSSHFCDECFETSASAEDRRRSAELRAAHCQYCGAPATIGTMDHLATFTGEQRTMFLCYACSAEFNDYTMLALNRMPHGLSEQEQLEANQQLRQDAEKHMKQWVSERGSQ